MINSLRGQGVEFGTITPQITQIGVKGLPAIVADPEDTWQSAPARICVKIVWARNRAVLRAHFRTVTKERTVTLGAPGDIPQVPVGRDNRRCDYRFVRESEAIAMSRGYVLGQMQAAHSYFASRLNGGLYVQGWFTTRDIEALIDSGGTRLCNN